jgi:hypothetical protein
MRAVDHNKRHAPEQSGYGFRPRHIVYAVLGGLDERE